MSEILIKRNLVESLLVNVRKRSDGAYDADVVRDLLVIALESGGAVATDWQVWGERWRFLALILMAAIFGWWLA